MNPFSRMNRREFLGRLALPILAAAAVLHRTAGNAEAASHQAMPGNAKPKPPGTCGGWVDRNGNGICERSENGSCNAAKCSANKLNPKFAEIAKAGAPKGACALWEDKSKAGFCSVSAKKDGCLCLTCPANKNHTA